MSLCANMLMLQLSGIEIGMAAYLGEVYFIWRLRSILTGTEWVLGVLRMQPNFFLIPKLMITFHER
jgi:hypothetical protein